MADLNVTAHTGNLTRDVEVRYLQNGTAVCDIGIAVGGIKDEVDFFDVTVFGQTAEYLGQYAKKGNKVSVKGRLKLDQWEKDGEKRSKVKIVADSVNILTAKPKDVGSETASEQKKNRAPAEDGDDVPF